MVYFKKQMMPFTSLSVCLLAVILLFSCKVSQEKKQTINPMPNHSAMKEEKENPHYQPANTNALTLSEEAWKEVLPPEVFYVARLKGTEAPWSSPLEHVTDKGVYHCKACGNPLFKSDTKFDSGCGWPSFFDPVKKGALKYLPDNSHGMRRTEVTCGKCNAHLGHVFEDGPPPTGLRYCINGVILKFEKG